MQYYYLCAKFEEAVLPTASTGFARWYRQQAPGLGCTETKLLLMVL